MIRLKDIIMEVVDAQPPANIQPSSNAIINSDYVVFIKKIENAGLTGYNKTKKLWFPHKSPEGGLPTIAYGHKIKDRTELKRLIKGISDKEATRLLTSDLKDANKRVHDFIKKKYKVNLILTKQQDEMLTEFAFNLGGLEKFPKFVDSVLRNNKNGMEKEYQRNYTDSSGQRKPLERRNKMFHDRFLK